MQSGIFLGYLGMIEGLVTRIKAQMMQDDSVIASPDEIRVFATGGLARVFQPHTRVFDRIEPELTLDGLRVIHHLNTSA
ncbi:MAG: hypothetical protein IT298_15490, partial [Chloroflexi bacterium]|nr:hypothetical protein [Chloroflexota bacterium]